MYVIKILGTRKKLLNENKKKKKKEIPVINMERNLLLTKKVRTVSKVSKIKSWLQEKTHSLRNKLQSR